MSCLSRNSSSVEHKTRRFSTTGSSSRHFPPPVASKCAPEDENAEDANAAEGKLPFAMKEEADEEGVTLLANVRLLLGTKLQLTLMALLVDETFDEKVEMDDEGANVPEDRK